MHPHTAEGNARRVVAITMDQVDWRTTFSKSGGIFPALDRRLDLVDVVHPPIGALDRLTYNVARRARPVGPLLGALRMSVRALDRRAARVEQLLKGVGPHDLVFADETLAFLPPGRPDRPYVIYTDNTYALADRWFPNWEPWGRGERARLIAYERDVYARAARVFVWSEFAARSVIDDYGCDEDVVHVVGVGTRKVELEPWPREPAPTALFVGINFYAKGGTTLLAAWNEVVKRLPEARLWIVGPPPRTAHPSIQWFGHLGSREALEDLYRRAHVFVLPSRYEPFGIVFLEAMMHGLPAIGTNRCAMPEIIQDGETGALVPADEPDALAEALVGLLGDLPRARRLGEAAYASVVDSMTWDAVGDRLVAELP